MKKLNLFILIIFIFFSINVFADEDLTGKNYLCSNLLWGFEFISSNKVKVINTDLNNKTNVREYYYQTDSELHYVNIYLMQNKIRDLIYSVHRKTLRVDIWTMTSGGNTTREFIPKGFCEITSISNILKHIENLKSINKK
tara:strand:+ start:237 stop:656 length:420 start_codon:yes stop_codon:yes gene_type:complete